jgi:hypothetical protein
MRVRASLPGILCVLALAACGDSSTEPTLSPSTKPDFLPSHDALRAALQDVLAEQNGGLGFEMWASFVDRDGVVQAVVFSGTNRADQWPGSRVISAQKANTANSFSLEGFALSTANLFAAVQPGGSLYGLQESNPVDPDVAYGGKPQDYGTDKDPMVGQRIGGVNVFGGGLARAPTTSSPGGSATRSTSTTCRPAWPTAARTTTSSTPTAPSTGSSTRPASTPSRARRATPPRSSRTSRPPIRSGRASRRVRRGADAYIVV